MENKLKIQPDLMVLWGFPKRLERFGCSSASAHVNGGPALRGARAARVAQESAGSALMEWISVQTAKNARVRGRRARSSSDGARAPGGPDGESREARCE